MAENDLKSGINVTVAGMFINIMLVVFKLWVGIVGKSQALMADGVHSLSDLLSDLIVILGIRWGRKEADEDHPFGHRRIETIAGLIIGVLLILVGVGISYDAFIQIAEDNFQTPSIFVIYVAVGSIISKEILFWYTRSVGRKIKSTVIIANAWHHRTDALSSVAVLIGVLFAYLNPDFYLADIIAAMVVSIFIIQVGVSLIWSALKEVVDTAPDKEILGKMQNYAENVEGVRQAHDLKARFSGALIFVEIHIVVDPDISVKEGHNIARDVKYKLLDNVEEVEKVIVHVDPELKKRIEELMISLEEFKNMKESLIIYQNEEIIFSSFDSDIIPLVKFIEQKNKLSGDIIIFDKYIGRAAGLLMTMTSPSFIYTPMISESAITLFIEHEIDFEATEIVKYLMGKASREMCQWEKLSIGKNPDEFLKLAQEKLSA